MPTPRPGSAQPVPDTSWRQLTRLAFRFTFSFLTLYALCCGNATLWRAIPLAGGWLETKSAAPFTHSAQALAQPLFHLTGSHAFLHLSGYNDRALDWIAAALILTLSLLLTLLWSLLDSHRPHYRTLFRWLRLLLRLTLAAAMFVYGFAKLFPIQIGSPSLAVLSEPVGNTSPMSLLWTLLGLSPAYERLCGLTEILAGLLLLYRRTTLSGALLSVVILTNILLFDCFFDVPVKLYAAMLLLMSLTLIAPDLRALTTFFLHRQPAAPTKLYDSPLTPLPTLLLEALVFLSFCLILPLGYHAQYAREQANREHPSPLAGQWHLDSSTPTPFLTGDAQPLTDLFLEPSGRLTARATDDTLWPGGRYDAHTLTLMSPLRHPLLYTLTQPDPTHLILQPSPINPTPSPELHLTRTPIPLHYRLFDRTFHLINEWGFEQ